MVIYKVAFLNKRKIQCVTESLFCVYTNVINLIINHLLLYRYSYYDGSFFEHHKSRSYRAKLVLIVVKLDDVCSGFEYLDTARSKLSITDGLTLDEFTDEKDTAVFEAHVKK